MTEGKTTNATASGGVVDAAAQAASVHDVTSPMAVAVASAYDGISRKHGGPFGAAIVKDRHIIAVAHNTVLLTNDPTNHAEMNCIRLACRMARSHDLSECELFTTCEPCPMCWGAANWARLRKVHIGVDRRTAATFGFDDEFFYQELDLKMEERSLKCIHGIMKEDVELVFKNSATHKRRLQSGGGLLAKMYERMFSDDHEPSTMDGEMITEDPFMQVAIDAAVEGMKRGDSKEREPFGAVVVKDGKVIATACNTVLRDRDPTATAELNAIRTATSLLGRYCLDDCDLFTTTEPDPMSLGAIYWARIRSLHVGVSQKLAAICGFEDGILHYRELRSSRDSRCVEIVDGVLVDRCREVFEAWKRSGGKLY